MDNQEVIINHLKQLVLSDEQIAEINIDYSELLDVCLGEDVFAPIWMNQLKTHLKHFPEEGQNLKVRAYQTENNWMALYQHSYFRSDSDRADVRAYAGESFHISVEGQVIGPFTSDEIQEKLNNIELLTTDIVSMDGGHNWLHLYQIDQFDRRTGESLQLPSAPDDQVMIPTHDDIQKRIDQLGRNFSETEAVAGLAYIGNLQTGKATEDEEWQKIKKNERDSKKLQRERAKAASPFNFENQNVRYTALFLFSLFGLYLLYATWDWGKPASKVSKRKSRTTKSRQAKTPVKPQQAQRKPAATTKPAPVKRVAPAKIKKSTPPTTKNIRRSSPFVRKSPFKKSNGRFDNGKGPVENDPVRSQVSPETLDPKAP